MAIPDWTFEWLQGGTTAIDHKLAELWDAEYERGNNVCLSFRLIRCWEETVAQHQGKQPYLVRAKSLDAHEVVYLLYAHESSVAGLKRTVIEPAGGDLDFDYQDPLSIGTPLTDSDWSAYWQALRQSVISQFPRLGYFCAYRLNDAISGGIGETRTDFGVSPYLPLAGYNSLDDVIAHCGTAHRSNVRRRLRKAEKMGGISLHIVAPNNIGDALEEMFSCYANQWGGQHGRHYFMHESARDFYRSLGHTAASLGKLHFSYLKVGENIWNWHFGLIHNGSLLWLKPTYAQGYEKFSPGLVHLALLINHCLENDHREIDFGYGPEPYKYLWTDQQRTLRTYEFFGNDPMLTVARRIHEVIASSRYAIARSKYADYLKWKWKSFRRGIGQG